MRLRIGWLTAFAVCIAAIPAHAAQGSFDRTLKVTGPVNLDVTTGAGDIHVRAGDGSTVQIHGTIRARSHWGDHESPEEKVQYLESHPPIEQDGNTIRVGHIEDREFSHNVSISFDLVVPAATTLHSEIGSGGQTVDGIHGPARIGTGSGSLRISNIGDEVRAETGSGDMQIDSVRGPVTAKTGSGMIRADGVAGEFTGETGSGDIHLRQTAPGAVKVDTGSGSIDLSGVNGSVRAEAGSGRITADGAPTGDWRLETGSGSINVRVPPQAAFDLHAHTSSGHISTVHPVTLQGTLSRGDWRGKVRGGGFLLDASTGSGDVRIE
ncbi:MAG TPA: DUF4097 family beta strand repeat-containing protein [Terriglobia bacterium]|nr:DUF4097 family beta strand repeat-containing protein [Terriglobia bacterium]